MTDTVTGKTVTVRGEFSPWGSGVMQAITFVDGASWSADPGASGVARTKESAAIGGAVYGGYGNSNDTLVAGLGDKYLTGEGGADTYVYTSAGGNDIIDGAAADRSSTLVMQGIASTNVVLARPNGGNDLVMLDTSTNETVTVRGEFSPWGSGVLQAITFADGVSWSQAQVLQVLQNQQASGAGGYVLGHGHGQSSIATIGNSTVQIAAGIPVSDVILQADNLGDLTVRLRDTGDSITFANDLAQNWWGITSQIQQLTFGDGTSVTVGQPGPGQGQPLTFTWIGTTTTTALTGSNYGTNVFDLGPGGDTVTGANNSRNAGGNNILVFDKGDGQARVDLNGGGTAAPSRWRRISPPVMWCCRPTIWAT